jgi:hypothetical protein
MRKYLRCEEILKLWCWRPGVKRGREPRGDDQASRDRRDRAGGRELHAAAHYVGERSTVAHARRAKEAHRVTTNIIAS